MRVLIPERERKRLERQRDYVQVDKLRFPLIFDTVEYEAHATPPNPAFQGQAIGTSTGWVKNVVSSPLWTHGVLTAGHVLSNFGIGQPISFARSSIYPKPTTGVVVIDQHKTIDSGVIEIDPRDWPNGLTKVVKVGKPTNGNLINLQLLSGTISGHVLQTAYCFGYTGTAWAERIVFSCHGNSGDSGTICSDVFGDCVGLYIAKITKSNTGNSEGVAQGLEQVLDQWNLELHL